jgi:choline dehydrogenase-like flavoprotein
MPTSPTSQVTDFSRDITGRFVCNGLDEALRSADSSQRPDARPFDVVVIGGGTFGAAFAQHLFSADRAHAHRILVLEGGPFALPEHVQNLPPLGLNSPAATSIADLRAAGQDRTARNEVWGLAWHGDAPFPGLAYCVGGRSLFWGGWSPQPLDSELAPWPADVVADLGNRYFRESAEQIGVTDSNDFIHGELHTALRQQLFDAIQAGQITGAVPFANLPLHLNVPAAAAAAGSSRMGRVTTTANDILKLEAPLAVQSRSPRSGFFPINKFSTVPLLMKSSRTAFNESLGDDVKKRLMAVPLCHVRRLVPASGPGGPNVAAIDTTLGLIQLSPNVSVVVALGTIESTRLALLFLNEIPAAERPNLPAGRGLMAHLRSNLDIRVPRTALTALDPAIRELQASALFVKGRHTFADGSFGHYHLQITASGLGRFGADSEAELFKKVPDVDGFEAFRNATDSHILITIRGIGEMEPSGNSLVRLDPEADEFQMQRAFVHLETTQKDRELWNVMDQAADDVAAAFANGQPLEILGRRRDGLGTTHHEGGTLRMGPAGPGVTDSDCRLRGVSNLYFAGPATFPSLGSPNPMLTGIGLTRRLADRVAARTAPVVEPGFQLLFDGASTANWRMSTIRNQPSRDNPGSFYLVDGAFESLPGSDIGLLWCSTPTPADFILRLEWLRWSQDANSGVFLRFPDPESKGYNNTAFVAVDFGFEVQIDEQGAPDGLAIHKTGAVYNQASQTLSQQPALPVGQWNQFEIRAQGQNYKVLLNGVQVSAFTNTQAGRGLPTGFLGFQTHTGRVAFRNIRIGPL